MLKHNLPMPRPSFVGRDQETGEVRKLLGTTRLLTLAGPGGAGKTRLALEVADDLIEEYADGAWLVELAPVAVPSLIPRALASSLQVRESRDASCSTPSSPPSGRGDSSSSSPLPVSHWPPLYQAGIPDSWSAKGFPGTRQP